MISSGFEVTASDFGYKLELTVRDSDGNIVDLTGVTGVFLHVSRLDNNRNLFSAQAVVVNPTLGKIEYEVQTGDFTKQGNYRGTLTLVYGTVKEITTGQFHITVNKPSN